MEYLKQIIYEKNAYLLLFYFIYKLQIHGYERAGYERASSFIAQSPGFFITYS